MDSDFIDPRQEVHALRRALFLLERVREDGPAEDHEVEALEAGVCAMRRAAAEDRLIHKTALDRIGAALARVEALADAASDDAYELLLRNAIVETRELLQRLARPHARAARAPAEMRNLSVV